MDKTINDYILKLSGKASVLKPLENGHSYKIIADGEIVSETIENNQDGTYNAIYKFNPAIVVVEKDNGETIKAKDIRKKSQQLRNCLFREWKDKNIEVEFEHYYEMEMSKFIGEVINRNI